LFVGSVPSTSPAGVRIELPGGAVVILPAEASAELPAAAVEEEIAYLRHPVHGWSELPQHLPREEVVLNLPEAERTCTCCGKPMQKFGEDRTEQVDYRPARIVVKVFVSPKPKAATPRQDNTNGVAIPWTQDSS
jgi:hypothetical protein